MYGYVQTIIDRLNFSSNFSYARYVVSWPRGPLGLRDAFRHATAYSSSRYALQSNADDGVYILVRRCSPQ